MRYKNHNAACHAALKSIEEQDANHTSAIKLMKNKLRSSWYQAFDNRDDIEMIQDRLANAAWHKSGQACWH